MTINAKAPRQGINQQNRPRNDYDCQQDGLDAGLCQGNQIQLKSSKNNAQTQKFIGDQTNSRLTVSNGGLSKLHQHP